MSKLFKNYHLENNLDTANKDSKSHTPLALLQKFPKGTLTSILYVKLYHSENVFERRLKNIKHLFLQRTWVCFQNMYTGSLL